MYVQRRSCDFVEGPCLSATTLSHSHPESFDSRLGKETAQLHHVGSGLRKLSPQGRLKKAKRDHHNSQNSSNVRAKWSWKPAASQEVCSKGRIRGMLSEMQEVESVGEEQLGRCRCGICRVWYGSLISLYPIGCSPGVEYVGMGVLHSFC